MAEETESQLLALPTSPIRAHQRYPRSRTSENRAADYADWHGSESERPQVPRALSGGAEGSGGERGLSYQPGSQRENGEVPSEYTNELGKDN